MNPFADLVRVATRPGPVAPVACSGRRDGESSTACLLRLLVDRAMSTLELQTATGLQSRQVWGLLKQPRNDGKVHFDGRLWRLDTRYVENKVASAIELLLSSGYEVRFAPRGSIETDEGDYDLGLDGRPNKYRE